MAIEVEAQHVEPLSSATVTLRVKDFIWSEDEWPTIKHDEFEPGEDIPVISLLKASGGKKTREYEEECRKMVEAGKWGFFKLVDHGVDLGIMEAMKDRCSELFDLPMDQKLKGERPKGMPLGYSASNPDYNRNLPWAEIIQLLQSPEQVIHFAQKIYGDQQYQPLSDGFIKYMDALDRLGMIIFEMLAHGLGLPDDFFTKNFQEKESTILRINQYPPCPLPERCLGLGSHTDPHALTILLQDEVGGLQVQKSNGEWAGIRPLPNSLIINIGDILEAWTNARLRSVVHRAVVNKEKKRLSVAYFLCPSSDTLVDCPQQLLNEADGRRKYTAFTWGEFRKELLIQKRVVGKTALNRYLIPDHPN